MNYILIIRCVSQAMWWDVWQIITGARHKHSEGLLYIVVSKQSTTKNVAPTVSERKDNCRAPNNASCVMSRIEWMPLVPKRKTDRTRLQSWYWTFEIAHWQMIAKRNLVQYNTDTRRISPRGEVNNEVTKEGHWVNNTSTRIKHIHPEKLTISPARVPANKERKHGYAFEDLFALRL